MRIYKSYMFFVGTKVPFNKLPCLVEEYLKKLGLHYKYFLYYLSERNLTDSFKTTLKNYADIYDPGGFRRAEAEAYLSKVKGCRKAQAEHPELGLLRKDRADKCFYLSNLDSPSAEAVDVVYPILNKIYRRYGISNTMFVYHGIVFFNTDSPCDISHENGELKELTGARIVLTRRNYFANDITITIHFDITENADDALMNDYRDAMIELFPAKVAVKEETYCVLSDEEKAQYRELQSEAEPIAERIGEAIRKAIRDTCSKAETGANEAAISLAPVLKKASKAYGFTYLKPYYHFYDVVKETPNAHILHAEMETGRCGDELNMYLDLIGAGFKAGIVSISFDPAAPDEAREAVFAFFEAVKSVENTALAQLDALFPKSPDKYLRKFVTNTAFIR